MSDIGFFEKKVWHKASENFTDVTKLGLGRQVLFGLPFLAFTAADLLVLPVTLQMMEEDWRDGFLSVFPIWFIFNLFFLEFAYKKGLPLALTGEHTQAQHSMF